MDSRIERVRSELKNIDGLLDVIEHPALRRHALIAWWPEAEPKRELVLKGEMDPKDAYDILGWFTEDPWDAETEALDVALDERVQTILGKCDNQRAPWRDRLKVLAEKNLKIRKAERQKLIDKAADIASDLWYMVGHNEEVRMKRIMEDVKKEAMKDE